MCINDLNYDTTSMVQNLGPPLEAQGGPSDTYSVMTKGVKENLEDAYQRCTLVTGNKTPLIINYYLSCFKNCCQGRYVLKTEE